MTPNLQRYLLNDVFTKLHPTSFQRTFNLDSNITMEKILFYLNAIHKLSVFFSKQSTEFYFPL